MWNGNEMSLRRINVRKRSILDEENIVALNLRKTSYNSRVMQTISHFSHFFFFSFCNIQSNIEIICVPIIWLLFTGRNSTLNKSLSLVFMLFICMQRDSHLLHICLAKCCAYFWCDGHNVSGAKMLPDILVINTRYDFIDAKMRNKYDLCCY